MNQLEFEEHLRTMHGYVHDWNTWDPCAPSDAGIHNQRHASGRANHKHNKDGSIYEGRHRE